MAVKLFLRRKTALLTAFQESLHFTCAIDQRISAQQHWSLMDNPAADHNKKADYKTALLTLPPSNQLTRDSMHHIYSHHSLQDHKLRSAWAEVGGCIASDVKDESVCVLSVRSISAVCLQCAAR